MTLKRALSPVITGDTSALDAARRLKAEWPVRRHVSVVADDRDTFVGKQQVEIGGEIYGSIRKAALAHGISPFQMGKWIETGKAKSGKA